MDAERTTEADESETAASPRAFGWVRWVIIPLLVFATAEAGARAWMKRIGWMTFIGRAERAARVGPIDYLFVGTSRVAASIDADAFSDEASRRLGRPARAVNLGTGYSSLVEHYFGLRTLVSEHPDVLRGGVVLIEAPGGIPDAITIGNRWDEVWTYQGQAHRIVPNIGPSDLRAIWRSGLTFADKLHFSFRTLSRGSTLLAHRDLIGNQIMIGLKRRVARIVAPAVVDAAAKAEADLTTEGGIRTDSESVQRVRAVAVVSAREWMTDQRPIRHWDDRVVGSLVRETQQAGAQVVFFEVPLHSLQADTVQTRIRQADRRAFRDQAARWGTVIVTPDFPTRDDDFPDIWHLKKSLAASFSRTLARAVVSPPPRRHPENGVRNRFQTAEKKL